MSRYTPSRRPALRKGSKPPSPIVCLSRGVTHKREPNKFEIYPAKNLSKILAKIPRSHVPTVVQNHEHASH
jgi:hypothetical protein